MLDEKEQEKPQEEEESYSFLQETIKPKKISRKMLIQQFVRIALYGLIFGGVASLGFFAVKPAAQRWLKGKPETVTIPEDDTPSGQEDAAAGNQNDPVDQTLSKENYEEILKSMYQAVKEAKKGVVSVSAASEEEDWDAEATGITSSVSGVITADNGQELLIFASESVCKDAEEWQVEFVDGTSYKASVKSRDKNSGFAVFSVAKNELSDTTWNAIHVAELGNSNLAAQGDGVIALGNTLGYEDGVSYGIISSTEYQQKFRDGECGVIGTDISGSDGATGILFNMDGEVIGMISDDIWEDKGDHTVNAYAISDLKSRIQLMANGGSVPYIGIYGTTVTGELQQNEGMPSGLYVIEVDPDSPAMAAGIQSGDIIWQVSGESVSSMSSYEKAVLEEKSDAVIRVKGKRKGADGYVDLDFTVNVGDKK